MTRTPPATGRLSLGAAAILLAMASPAGAGLPPRYGGRLRVGIPAPPAELDPARATTAGELLAARAAHATLVEADAAGALRPGLLAALPEAEPGGFAFRLRLRPGLRFHGGEPVTAADVAASLARLLWPQTRSPHGWIAVAVKGSEEVRAGRAATLAGVQVLSPEELRIELELPFRDFPGALAAVPAAVVPRGAPPAEGAGPFRRAGGSPGARFAAFDGFFRGRPYADGLDLLPLDAPRAARALSRAEVELALRPEAVPGAVSPVPLAATTATWALVPQSGPLRRALQELDRAELARFVRGPAAPLANPLPPALWPAASGGGTSAPGPAATPGPAPTPGPTPTPAAAGTPTRAGGPPLTLLVAAGAETPRAVADRLQVKLFDRGMRVAVRAVPPEAFAARLAAGQFDLALVTRTLVAPAPAPAAVELAWALGGAPAARRAISRLASADPGTAAAEAAEEAGAVPLVAAGLLASPRAGLHGLAPLPGGGLDPGDLWILPAPGAP